MEPRKMKIVDTKYSVTGPVVAKVGPNKVETKAKIYSCALILTDGTPQPPTLENVMGETERHTVVGQHVVKADEVNEEVAKSEAYKAALNRVYSYGFTVVE